MKLPPAFKSLLITLLIFVGTFAARAEPDPSFHLYLLIGQSNMAGRGVVDEESSQTNAKVLTFTKAREWAPAADPIHFDKPSAGVGPGVAFGKHMAALDTSVRIGLIPCAVGGTSIKAWVPGAEDKATRTHPYSDMVERVVEARKAGVIKGIIWHQGESDRNSATGYAKLLSELVGRLRSEFGEELPFVSGELSSFNPKDDEPTQRLNAELHSLERSLKRYACISSEGLGHKGDKLHYDAAAARVLGKRYAEKLAELQRP